MHKKSFIFASAFALLLIFGAVTINITSPDGSSELSYPMYSVNMTQEALAARFDHLSQQKTNSCGGGKDYVAWLSDDGKRIQGSCCSPMTLHSYEDQIEGLKKYADYDIIPPDPYDVSAVWADGMMEYAEQTKLSAEQQAIYDEAMKMSREGGPCCCVCWHWYAYEGLAKHLIASGDFSSEQIAEIWDLSDACGGDHNHGH